jgi:hypothetical protein
MAIKRGLIPQIAEIGKIKTGYKGEEITSGKGNKFRPPKKLDYFVVTTTERDTATGNLIKNDIINKKLGAKPRELRIRLPFDTIDKNFYTKYQYYASAKKICDGDGEKAVRVDDKNNKSEMNCNPETCEFFKSGKCKVSGILSAFLPDAEDFGGVFKYRTHSYNAVSSILAALEYFAANTGGILHGLPLKLVMLKKTTKDHGTIDYTTIIIDGGEIRRLRELATEEKQSRLLLGADIKKFEEQAERTGFFRDTDPEKDIQEEFYPENDEENIKNVTPIKGSSADDVKNNLESKIKKVTPEVKEPIVSVEQKKGVDLF